NVFSVLPAHLAVVTRDRFAARRYWDFDTSGRIRLASFNEYAEAFAEHFGRAVRRRLRTSRPPAVSVSGGLDSSSIFCVAQRQGPQTAGQCAALGLSYISPDGSLADERRFLLDIEHACGASILRIPCAEPGVMRRAREELWHVEAPLLDGLGNRLHTLLQPPRTLLESAVARRGRVVLPGHWGDQVLCERNYLLDLARHFQWITVWKHLRELPRWYADVEHPGFTQAFFRELIRAHAPRFLVDAA